MDLHEAARRGNRAVIRQLAAAGADLDARDDKGRTPLTVAARAGKWKTVDLLLKLGADPEIGDRRQRTVLNYALDAVPELALIRRLIELGCDVNARGPVSKSTPLLRACSEGRRDVVGWLLERGADANVREAGNGFTPLLHVCKGRFHVREISSDGGPAQASGDAEQGLRDALAEANQWLETGEPPAGVVADPTTPNKTRDDRLALVRLLLAAGADPSEGSAEGFTPVMLAAQSGNRALLRELIDAGADVNAGMRDSGETALMRGCSVNVNPNVVSDLLEAEADPNTVDQSGRTALLYLVEQWPHDPAADRGDTPLLAQAMQMLGRLSRLGCPEAFEALVRAGADLDARDDEGRTALMIAAQRGLTGAVEALLKAGADPNLCDEDGNTALALLGHGGPPALRALVEAAAGGEPARWRPRRALLNAVTSGIIERVRDELAAGARLDGDRRDVPPLVAAAAGGHLDIVRLLLEAGAKVQVESEPQERNANTPLAAAAAYGHLDVLRALIAAGADVNRKDRYRTSALMAAADARQWEAVDVLRAAGAVDPDADALIALRHFDETARQPAYRGWVERLGQRFGRPGQPVESMTGAYVFELPRGVERDTGADPDDFLKGWQADQEREGQYKVIVAELGDAVRADGYHLVFARAFIHAGVMLLPTPDKYAVLAAFQTNGCNCEVYPADVIRWLREMELDDPFVLDGVSHDYLEGRFLRPVRDPKRLAKQMAKFCPDIVHQGVGTVKKLAAELERTQRLYFWWD